MINAAGWKLCPTAEKTLERIHLEQQRPAFRLHLLFRFPHLVGQQRRLNAHRPLAFELRPLLSHRDLLLDECHLVTDRRRKFGRRRCE